MGTQRTCQRDWTAEAHPLYTKSKPTAKLKAKKFLSIDRYAKFKLMLFLAPESTVIACTVSLIFTW